MSWSCTVPGTPAADFAAAVDAAAKETIEAMQRYWPDEDESNGKVTLDQITAAVAAAKSFVDSGAVGSSSHRYGAELSGHANPNHAPHTGYSHDWLTVHVYQVDENE